MNKAYTRIVWENYPSTGTPLNESNLNRMDSALDIIDDRVVSMDTTKLDKNTAYTMVKSITFNEDTGIFTITYLNGSTSTLDTKLEKLAVNFGFDAESEKLTITLEDGTVQEVDLSALISKYNFEDSSTIGFTVGSDGNVVAIVKEGSIQGKHLEPNYLANVTTQAENASASASNAAISAMNAAASAEAAEAAAERAESVSSVSIATTEKPGIVKPDGTTIAVGADGSISVGESVTKEINSVKNDLENLTAEDVGALPITGGFVTGDLAGGLIDVRADGHATLRFLSGDGLVRGAIQCRPEPNRIVFLQRETGASYSEIYRFPALTTGLTADKGYDIFTTKNKPSGSYTGNGSATSRTVNVGSIGGLIYVYSPRCYMALVGRYGAICWDTSSKTVAVLTASEVMYNEGVLTISTTNAHFNYSNSTYYYFAL